MTILSLDDPNLNAEDPSVQLSTMPENLVNQFTNVAADPRMQLQGVVQPVLQPVNPVVQSSRYQFVDGVQANQQTGQQFGTNWPMGQAPVPVHSQFGQSHPQIAQYEQHNTGQTGPPIGQSHPSQVVNPVIDQGYSSHQQMHHSQPQPAHHTSPPSVQSHLPIGQPTTQTGQSHPAIVQGIQPGQQLYQQHPAHTNVHVASQMGQSHPTIVQPTPQIGLHNPGIAQTALNSNQRVTYGPIPNPPGYEQALNLPSQPPPPEPLPPPISLPVPNQLQNQFDGQGGQFLNPVAPHSVEYYQTGYSQQHVYTTPHQGGQVGNQFQNQVQPIPPGNQFSNPVEPVPQPGNEAADSGTEKIRELERQLKMKEESERARMEREKEAILREKQKWEEEKLHERQEIEQRKLELVQQQAALVKGKEHLEEMRLQIEEERKQSVKDSEQLRQMLQIQQSAQRDQRAFTVNQGLPTGWEKRLDHTTGRFFYVDHGSKTTHWNPPANWLDYQSQLQQRRTNERGVVGQIPGQVPQQNVVPAGQISHRLPPGQHPPVGRHDNLQPMGGSLPRAQQQPSVLPQQPQIRKIAAPTSVSNNSHPGQQQSHPQTGHPISNPAVPSVDRSSKPQMPASTPSVDRSTKPTVSPAEYKRKLNALQPMFGSSQVGGA